MPACLRWPVVVCPVSVCVRVRVQYESTRSYRAIALRFILHTRKRERLGGWLKKESNWLTAAAHKFVFPPFDVYRVGSMVFTVLFIESTTVAGYFYHAHARAFRVPLSAFLFTLNLSFACSLIHFTQQNVEQSGVLSHLERFFFFSFSKKVLHKQQNSRFVIYIHWFCACVCVRFATVLFCSLSLRLSLATIWMMVMWSCIYRSS